MHTRGDERVNSTHTNECVHSHTLLPPPPAQCGPGLEGQPLSAALREAGGGRGWDGVHRKG